MFIMSRGNKWQLVAWLAVLIPAFVLALMVGAVVAAVIWVMQCNN